MLLLLLLLLAEIGRSLEEGEEQLPAGEEAELCKRGLVPVKKEELKGKQELSLQAMVACSHRWVVAGVE